MSDCCPSGEGSAWHLRCRAPGRGARRSASLVVPWAMLGGWVKGFRGAECPEGGPPVNAVVKGRLAPEKSSGWLSL